jgi:hypothetical protein
MNSGAVGILLGNMLRDRIGEGGRVNCVPLLREGGSRQGEHEHERACESLTKRAHRILQSSSTDENAKTRSKGDTAPRRRGQRGRTSAV